MERIIKFGFIICFWLTAFSFGTGVPACLWDQWQRAALPFTWRLTMILGAIWFAIVVAHIWNRKKVRFWRYFLGFGCVYLVFMNHYIPKNLIPNPPYFSILDRPDNPGPNFMLRWQLQYPCWDSTHDYKLYFDTRNNMILAIMDSDHNLDFSSVPSWEKCILTASDEESVSFSPQKNQMVIFHKRKFQPIPVPDGFVDETEIYKGFSEKTAHQMPEFVNMQLEKLGLEKQDFTE